MKNLIITKIEGVQEPGILQKNIQSNPDAKYTIKNVTNEHIEKELNAKILEVAMKIRYHYPELSKYLDEIPVIIPAENDREITLNHLKKYYESLSTILDQYKLNTPKSENNIDFSA